MSCDVTGGWALRVPDEQACPTRNIECGRGLRMKCCPDELSCLDGYCCPQGTDCAREVNINPQCADPSWSLWGKSPTINSDGWCCEPSFFGVVVLPEPGNGGGVACSTYGAVLSSGETAAFQVTSVSSRCSVSTTSSTADSISSTNSSASSSNTQISSPTPTSSVPSASAAAVDNGRAGLSGGGIAGVVIGGIAGLALLVLGVFFLGRRMGSRGNRDMRADDGGIAPQPNPYTVGKDSRNMYELNSEPGGGPPVELSANRSTWK